jgi:hypothetical protein
VIAARSIHATVASARTNQAMAVRDGRRHHDRLRLRPNVTADGGASYTWDWAGRLVTAEVDATTSMAVYDGDGTRVGLDGDVQHWDRLGPWPLLIGAGSDRIVHAAGPLAQVSGWMSAGCTAMRWAASAR